MKDKMISAYVKVQTALFFATKSFKEKDRGAVNVVEIVVIIGIAVLLAVVFRGQIEKLLKSLFDSINGNASKAVN